VPAVDIILFADKKKSRVDIVQAIGRCLRKSPGKKFGYIVVPFIFDKNQSKEKLLQSDYKDVIKTIRILSLYDKTFSEDVKFQAKTGKYFNGKVEIDFPYDDKIIDVEEIKKAIRIENFRRIGPLNWLPFDQAKEQIQSKNFSSSAEYYSQHKQGFLDADLPFDPQKIYEDEGWSSWGDFLGTGRIADQLKHDNYLSYKEAKKIIHPLKIPSVSKWRKFIKTKEFIFDNIPKNPNQTYEIHGTWITWGDFLGTGRVSDNLKQYRPFEKAREFARSLKIKKRTTWNKMFKEGKIPNDIPAVPHNTYKDEFISYADFFDNLSITNKIDFWSLSRSKNFIYNKKISSVKEFQKWSAITGNRPVGFPGNPGSVYKENKNWKGMVDFLGNHKKPYRKFKKG
jgi:hypothetical protein